MERTPEHEKPPTRPPKPVPFRFRLNFENTPSDEEDEREETVIISSNSLPESRLREPLNQSRTREQIRVDFDNSATSSSSDGTPATKSNATKSTAKSKSRLEET